MKNVNVVLGNSSLGMQCGKILDFSECTDAKSANIPKNPKNLHSHTANTRIVDSSKKSSLRENPQDSRGNPLPSSLRASVSERGNLVENAGDSQKTSLLTQVDCHADFQSARNDKTIQEVDSYSLCKSPKKSKYAKQKWKRDFLGEHLHYFALAKFSEALPQAKKQKAVACLFFGRGSGEGVAFFLFATKNTFAEFKIKFHKISKKHLSLLTNTLKTLIFLTGVLTMTTQATQNNATQTKQNTHNTTKSTTALTHTEIKGIKIPVIYEYSALIPAGNIQLVFQGGGSINADKIALSALKDEILSRGTSKSGNLGFANALEEKAISLSASSGNQTLNFYLSFLKEYQKDAIDLLGELLHYPNLKEINKAKTALQARILSQKSDFDFLASELLNKQLFALTPLANPTLGTQKDVKNLTQKDIKASLDSSLNLNNVIIVIGGDLELESSLKMLEPILKDLKKGEPYTKKHFEISTKPSFVTQNAPTQQAYIYFGSPLKMQNLKEERYLARVAGFILGASGFGSRLMEEVRVKRGLAYGAYFRYVPSPLISYSIGQLQTKLESQDEAIKVVREVISDFVKNGATQKELDSAKQFLLGSEPLGNETLSQRLGRSFNEYYLGLEIGFYKQELEKIKNLELKVLNDYIKSHPEIAELTFGIITQESKQDSKAESKSDSSPITKKK